MMQNNIIEDISSKCFSPQRMLRIQTKQNIERSGEKHETFQWVSIRRNNHEKLIITSP